MSKCRNIVITGANRGIGLELVKQLLSQFNPDNIFATYRDSASSKDLLDLASQNPKVYPIILDVRKSEKYGVVVSQVEWITGDAGVNLLINNSGVYNKEQNTLEDLTKEDIMYHFEVNTIAPIMITQAFLPLLEKGSKSGSGPLGIGRAAVVQVSSTMGSIGDNTSGGSYSYRMSKTALNQASKNMSIDLLGKGILTMPLHPGWVRTDMGGSHALISTEQSVSGILSVLEGLNERNNGHFIRFDGKEAIW